jgi:hypothetical protein
MITEKRTGKDTKGSDNGVNIRHHLPKKKKTQGNAKSMPEQPVSELKSDPGTLRIQNKGDNHHNSNQLSQSPVFC